MALLRVTHDWHEYLDKGQEVGAIFFDLRKAFDSIPHRRLIEKECNLPHALIRWISSYLTCRSQKVVVEGAISRSKPVVSGVPQGSVLGPLLFLIYINDVTNIELSPGTLLSLYADDMLLYKQINSLNDYTDLQTDINKISGWADANYLEFNTNKCKTMILTRKSKPGSFPPLQLKNVTLEQVESYKYLGVTIVSPLVSPGLSIFIQSV